MKRLSIVAAIVVTAAVGCSGAVDGGFVRTSTPTAASPVSSAGCAVTKPQPAFRPPARYPATPAPKSQAWYGSARLWTALDVDGEMWRGLPGAPDGTLTQKTFWWSESFSVATEEQPAISVEGRRLDRPGPTFHAGNPGTNAAFDETT